MWKTTYNDNLQLLFNLYVRKKRMLDITYWQNAFSNSKCQRLWSMRKSYAKQLITTFNYSKYLEI
jgi:hypothetical protein